MSVNPTPFHLRTAEHNLGNLWFARGPLTVPARYGDPHEEALAARVACVLIDASALSRLRVHGPGAAKLLARACATDMESLAPGAAKSVVWRADGGGLRGVGVVARFGAANFTLTAFDTDGPWFAGAAKAFDATVRDESMEKGLLLLVGPFAGHVLQTAGLGEAASLEPGHHAVQPWRGLTVTVSRWSELPHVLGGYEIACANDDGLFVFDRLWRAGQSASLQLAGQEAWETLLLEQGVPISGIDFTPARDWDASKPLAGSLGLGDLAGETNNAPDRVLAGIECESEDPVPFAPVMDGNETVGATLRSAYSPALKRAIALAQLERAHATPGVTVAVRRVTPGGFADIHARVTALPIFSFAAKAAAGST